MRSPEHAQSMSCILLHAADLNNAAKDFELSVRWTSELYIEFEKQVRLALRRPLWSAAWVCRSPF